MQHPYAGDTAVLIPSYKPDHKLIAYVATLRKAGLQKIVIVDDGSGTEYRTVFDAIPQDDTVQIIHYEPNCGKGVALKRGLAYLQDECPQCRFIVTADSDGQHTVTDVLRMSESLHQDGDGLLLGSRNFSEGHVPFKSRMGNRITSMVFRVLYGQWVSDTQTGLRGFSRELLPHMLQARGDRYEYEMNVLIVCAASKIKIRALPIETVYENNNEGSHFRAVRDSARIYGVILSSFVRFMGVSLISFGVDYGVYLLLNNLFKAYVPALEHHFRFLFVSVLLRIAAATIVARMISGVLNFFLNKQFVFSSGAKISRTFPRYLCVFFTIMMLSAALTSSLHLWTGWSDNTAKIPVDIVLFFLSYSLQQQWVFAKTNEKKAPIAS